MMGVLPGWIRGGWWVPTRTSSVENIRFGDGGDGDMTIRRRRAVGGRVPGQSDSHSARQRSDRTVNQQLKGDPEEARRESQWKTRMAGPWPLGWAG